MSGRTRKTNNHFSILALGLLPELRDRAVRGLGNLEHLFYDNDIFKNIVWFIFIELIISDEDEVSVAIEFWKFFKFLSEGNSVKNFKFKFLDNKYVQEKMVEIIAGNKVSLDTEGTQYDELLDGIDLENTEIDFDDFDDE